jgi:hypothetical protein
VYWPNELAAKAKRRSAGLLTNITPQTCLNGTGVSLMLCLDPYILRRKTGGAALIQFCKQSAL